MIRINNALSNVVYYDVKNNRIIKKYNTDEFKLCFHNQEYIFLDLLNIDYIFNKEDNIINIEYFKHDIFTDKNATNDDIRNISESILNFHSLSTKGIEKTRFKEVHLNVLLKGKGFKKGWIENEENIFNMAMKIFNSGKQVTLHNDLVEGNFLKINNEIKLIDFEYSGVGNYIFDIASFLTEREISNEQREIFIEETYKDINKKDLLIVSAFLQIFWTRWAFFKFESTKKEIYKTIGNWKYSEYLKLSLKIKDDD